MQPVGHGAFDLLLGVEHVLVSVERDAVVTGDGNQADVVGLTLEYRVVHCLCLLLSPL